MTDQFSFPSLENNEKTVTKVAKLHKEVVALVLKNKGTPRELENIAEIIHNIYFSEKENFAVQFQNNFRLSGYRIQLMNVNGEDPTFSKTNHNVRLYGVILILPTIVVTEAEEDFCNENFAEIVYSIENPGHVKLRIHNSSTVTKWKNSVVCPLGTNPLGESEGILHPEKFLREFYTMTCTRQGMYCIKRQNENFDSRSFRTSQKEELLYSRERPIAASGKELFPLITRVGETIQTSMIDGSGNCWYQYTSDLVIPCKWPTVGYKWSNRHRRSEWINQSSVTEMMKCGCELVPQPSPSTSLEWRISFQLVEQRLLNHSSTDQKASYLIFKSILKNFLNPPAGNGIKSYHLKHVFLWECDEVAQEKWSSTVIVIRIMGLLQRLETCLLSSKCPNYFIPESNLFHNIDKDVLVFALANVQTYISKANVLWIDNDIELYKRVNVLSDTSSCIMKLYVEILEIVLHNLRRKVMFDTDDNNLEVSNHEILEKVETESRDILSAASLGTKITHFVVRCLGNSCTDGAKEVKHYMFLKNDGNDLFVSGQSGDTDSIERIASIMLEWGDMTELVTKLIMYNNQDLTRYGFSKDYAKMENRSLLRRYGVSEEETSNIHVSINTSEIREFKGQETLTDDQEKNKISVDISFVCDVCKRDITGNRYHCVECKDFDMCPDCFDTNTIHDHVFVPLDSMCELPIGDVSQCKQS